MPMDFDWVDAFAATPFGGNPCMVVHEAADIPETTRTALVRETSLSECAYLVGSAIADFGARFYLADKEILMAGHPTIATAISLLDRGMVRLEGGSAEFTLEVGAGVLPLPAPVLRGRRRAADPPGEGESRGFRGAAGGGSRSAAPSWMAP